MIKKMTIAILIIVGILMIGCSCEKVERKYTNISEIPKEKWDRLTKVRIFFAHQSVGYNIIDGIKDVMEKYPKINLNIVESLDMNEICDGGIAHYQINGNKTNNFEKFVEDYLIDKVDIAFFKYCFVDVLEKTDTQKIYDEYVKTMSNLEKQYKDIIFLHFTVPLTFHQTGFQNIIAKAKGFIKKVLGKFDMNIFFDNKKRNELNNLLRLKFGNNNNFFDIAEIESTRPNGERETFDSGGRLYFAMAKEYTEDGGHLNELGRIIVAEKLLLKLINLM